MIIIGALDARKLQYKLALPSHRHLIKIVENKTHIENFPLNLNSAKGTEDIWWENLGCLTGKNPCRRTPHIRETLLLIPLTNLQRYCDITLIGYVMYINGIFFVNTISCHIKFTMAENISNA